jgi:hypothetical protein
MVVEKAPEKIASRLQRASGDHRRQAHVPRCVPTPSVRDSSLWLLRVAQMTDGRQPYFISAADGSVLSFAGLYDRWKNPETGEPVIS